MKFFGAPNCRGRADTLKLQSKLSNSAAEKTGLGDYMASNYDIEGERPHKAKREEESAG